MMHRCINCGTTFTRRSSLLRHEKDRCKRGIYHHGSNNIKHDITNNPNRKAIPPLTVSNDESFRVKSLDEDQYYNATDGANSAMNETYNRSPLENVRKSNIVRRNHNLTSSSLEQNHEDEPDECCCCCCFCWWWWWCI